MLSNQFKLSQTLYVEDFDDDDLDDGDDEDDDKDDDEDDVTSQVALAGQPFCFTNQKEFYMEHYTRT